MALAASFQLQLQPLPTLWHCIVLLTFLLWPAPCCVHVRVQTACSATLPVHSPCFTSGSPMPASCRIPPSIPECLLRESYDATSELCSPSHLLGSAASATAIDLGLLGPTSTITAPYPPALPMSPSPCTSCMSHWPVAPVPKLPSPDCLLTDAASVPQLQAPQHHVAAPLPTSLAVGQLHVPRPREMVIWFCGVLQCLRTTG